MRLIIVILAVIAATLPSASCSPKRTAVELFPAATEVRLFANSEVIGRVSEEAFPPGTVPAKGAVLTASEVEILRGAITSGQEPSTQTACCNPRHAFVFYDGNGSKLGVLTVCFECDCADVYDAPSFRARKLDWIYWNREKLANIVLAHKLPLYE
jgi:hypothetical protein